MWDGDGLWVQTGLCWGPSAGVSPGPAVQQGLSLDTLGKGQKQTVLFVGKNGLSPAAVPRTGCGGAVPAVGCWVSPQSALSGDLWTGTRLGKSP